MAFAHPGAMGTDGGEQKQSAASRGMVRARALENYKKHFAGPSEVAGGDDKKALVMRRLEELEREQYGPLMLKMEEPEEPEELLMPEGYGPMGMAKHVHRTLRQRQADREKKRLLNTSTTRTPWEQEQAMMRRLRAEEKEAEEKKRARGRRHMRQKRRERVRQKRLATQKKELLLKRQLLIHSHEHLKTGYRPYSGRSGSGGCTIQSGQARSKPLSAKEGRPQYMSWRPPSQYRRPTTSECEEGEDDREIFTKARTRPRTSSPARKQDRERLAKSWAIKSPIPTWGDAHGLLQRTAWEPMPKYCHAPANGYHWTPGYGYGYAPRR